MKELKEGQAYALQAMYPSYNTPRWTSLSQTLSLDKAKASLENLKLKPSASTKYRFAIKKHNPIRQNPNRSSYRAKEKIGLEQF